VRHLVDLEHLKSAPDPIQAQRAFERRALWDDIVAHLVALLMTIGFFALALSALLGLVDLTQPVIATLIGTTLGYAVGKLSVIMPRYFPFTDSTDSEERKP
jgi:protein-S-isoprenylcysteine O-methyltransferase Ste14